MAIDDYNWVHSKLESPTSTRWISLISASFHIGLNERSITKLTSSLDPVILEHHLPFGEPIDRLKTVKNIV